MTTAAVATPASALDVGTLLERADALAYLNAELREMQFSGDVEEGEVPAWLDELLMLAEADLKTKAERAGLAARRLTQACDAIRAEEAVLAKRRAARERDVERLRTYLRMCLELAGETRVETPLVSVAIQKNGGRPSVRWTLDPTTLPEAFRKPPTPPSLDSAAAHAYLAQHGKLPDGFEVAGPTFSLRIR